MKRWVDVDTAVFEAERRFDDRQGEAGPRSPLGPDDVGQIVRDILERQTPRPDLIGPSVAAGIMGVQPTHVSRMVESGRFPTPIEIEGSGRAFFREEVEEAARGRLAEKRRREREAEERARARSTEG